ncbi:MAG TPA: hypothetical protein VFQ45_22700 [Longimicrobium sp.]|nr:hypothetical protein [Longimicrobium sp.]
MATIVIPTLKFQLNTGDRITLKAENGLYLARDPAHQDWITASASTPGPTSQFVVHVAEDSRISLEADNGRFVIRDTSAEFNPLVARERSADQYTELTLTVFDDATVALKADNKFYVGRYSYKAVQTVSANRASIDQYCHFQIAETS